MNIKFFIYTLEPLLYLLLRKTSIRAEFAIFISIASRQNKPWICELNLLNPTDSIVILSMVDELRFKRFCPRS